MLKLMDSGCVQHPPQPIRLTGQTAALVDCLVLNLPRTEAGHTYICEYGHTHCLRLRPCEGNATSTPPRFGFTGSPPLHH
jgi:hypothetical protein